MEGLPPVDNVISKDERSSPLLFQKMMDCRKSQIPDGQNWGPDDFGSEADFISTCVKILDERGLNISSTRVENFLKLERLICSEPQEAIEKYENMIFLQK